MPYGYWGYYYDPTYLLVLIAAILSILASARVNTTFQKYNRVPSRSGMTGAQAAERLLHSNGIYDVSIEHVRGTLTDHYDPRTKTVRLSDSTYHATSVAAIGVAAHECGHVLQHHQEYVPLKLRTMLVPAANLGSRAGVPLILLGIILGYNNLLIQIGIWVFALAVLFQIVTLPVEYNASKRALRLLQSQGILTETETGQSGKVLQAAALTYVAAAANAVLQLLRLILLTGNGRRRD